MNLSLKDTGSTTIAAESAGQLSEDDYHALESDSSENDERSIKAVRGGSALLLVSALGFAICCYWLHPPGIRMMLYALNMSLGALGIRLSYTRSIHRY